MNRKFWRWVEKLASDKLAKDETNKNWPGVKNEFHQTRNEIHSAWQHNGELLVKRVVDQMDTRFSDTNVVLKEAMTDVVTRQVDQGSVSVKSFVERGNSLLMATLGRIFMNVHGLETKMGDWVNQIIRGSEELSRQVSVHDANDYERTAQLGEEIRRLRMKVDEHQSLNYKTLLALHNDTVARIEGLKSKDKEQFASSPTLEWLIDNMEGIERVAELAKAIRENHMPRDTGIYKLVSAIRGLELYSAIDVRDEVESMLNKWEGTAPSNVHRLHA